MKLFTAVNKKIKFSEKDYVEKNYIRSDGKAVIPIDIPWRRPFGGAEKTWREHRGEKECDYR